MGTAWITTVHLIGPLKLAGTHGEQQSACRQTVRRHLPRGGREIPMAL